MVGVELIGGNFFCIRAKIHVPTEHNSYNTAAHSDDVMVNTGTPHFKPLDCGSNLYLEELFS